MDNRAVFEQSPRLTRLIGWAVQAGSLLELALHQAHSQLAVAKHGESGFRRHEKVWTVEDLVKDLSSYLGVAGFSAEVRAAAEGLLADISDANTRRNAVVHGVWSWEDQERLTSWRYKPKQGFLVVDLNEDDVLQLVVDMGRAHIRVGALHALAHRQPWRGEVDAERTGRIEHLEAQLRGEFDLMSLGAFRMHSHLS